MRENPPAKTVIARPGRKIAGKTGQQLTIIIPADLALVDSHAHIENGACVPLPLLWNQMPLKGLRMKRKGIDFLANVFKHSAGRVQERSTAEIGNRAVTEIDSAFGPKSDIGNSEIYKYADLFTFLVIQMMDMEYDGADQQSAIGEDIPKETQERLFTPEGYFWTNYVHPRVWRDVLNNFPNLKLCLAHFGGDEWKRGLDSDWITEIISLTEEFPNVYTDFSCWDLDDWKETFKSVLLNKQYSHLKEKILFGTDWYMTLIALRGKTTKNTATSSGSFFRTSLSGKICGNDLPLLIRLLFMEFMRRKMDQRMTSCIIWRQH
ncbi:MAG: amidohydrolase family protein [Chitinivibrionales bacterium]|nr:amidohydrolase family protein [Chitinivibrionales bacterium]